VADVDRKLGGYDPNAAIAPTAAARHSSSRCPPCYGVLLSENIWIPAMPRLPRNVRLCHTEERADPRLRWFWQALAATLVAAVFAADSRQARRFAPGCTRGPGTAPDKCAGPRNHRIEASQAAQRAVGTTR